MCVSYLHLGTPQTQGGMDLQAGQRRDKLATRGMLQDKPSGRTPKGSMR